MHLNWEETAVAPSYVSLQCVHIKGTIAIWFNLYGVNGGYMQEYLLQAL